MSDFDAASRQFFSLPRDEKMKLKRSANNARGYFDDELTKQRRDWKEALDVGRPASCSWDVRDGDASNECLEGYNVFPDELLPDFRGSVTSYFEEMTQLSLHLISIMLLGLGLADRELIDELRSSHTSYLRLNFYPRFVPNEDAEAGGSPAPLGISPHKDAGLLTVLRQDDDCHSLQVRSRDGVGWVSVSPVPGALTINTGDMFEIVSNRRAFAPEHRVLTSADSERYSAPFFFNPGYRMRIAPDVSLGEPVFDEVYWGYFRAQRFAGDFSDYGAEIQTSDFLLSGSGDCFHVENQRKFMRVADFTKRFDCDAFEPLLARGPSDSAARLDDQTHHQP